MGERAFEAFALNEVTKGVGREAAVNSVSFANGLTFTLLLA